MIVGINYKSLIMNHLSKNFANINSSTTSIPKSFKSDQIFLNSKSFNKSLTINDDFSSLIFDKINNSETKYNRKSSVTNDDLKKLRNEESEKEIAKCEKNEIFINKEQCYVSPLQWPGQVKREQSHFKPFGTYLVPDKISDDNNESQERIMYCGIGDAVKDDIYCQIYYYKNLQPFRNILSSGDKIFTKKFDSVSVPNGCEIISFEQNNDLARFVGCFMAKENIGNNNLNFYLLSFEVNKDSFDINKENIIKIDSVIKNSQLSAISKQDNSILFYQKNDDSFKITKFEQTKSDAGYLEIIEQKNFANKSDACKKEPKFFNKESREVSKSLYHGNNICVSFYNNPKKDSSTHVKGPTKSWLDGIYAAILIPIGLTLSCSFGIYELVKRCAEDEEELNSIRDIISSIENSINIIERLSDSSNENQNNQNSQADNETQLRSELIHQIPQDNEIENNQIISPPIESNQELPNSGRSSIEDITTLIRDDLNELSEDNSQPINQPQTNSTDLDLANLDMQSIYDDIEEILGFFNNDTEYPDLENNINLNSQQNTVQNIMRVYFTANLNNFLNRISSSGVNSSNGIELTTRPNISTFNLPTNINDNQPEIVIDNEDTELNPDQPTNNPTTAISQRINENQIGRLG